MKLRRTILQVIISLITAAVLLSSGARTWSVSQHQLIRFIHMKTYDLLMKAKYKLTKPPAAINDITLVLIDNKTFNNMKNRWPFPRSEFASVIENLKSAGARAIGMDFIFYGRSSEEEDARLKEALEEQPKVVLAAALDEEGKVNTSTASIVTAQCASGIVTKVRDPDAVVRRNLTYLVSGNDATKCIFSWEMQLLNATKGVDLASLKDEGVFIRFRGTSGERWVIPVDRARKSFLINFTSRTSDFRKLSFYDVFNGDFNPADVKDKIVIIGFKSSVFWDFYNTPIGMMPGVTLNANAFLTLYANDIIRKIPKKAEMIFVFAGVALAAALLAFLSMRQAFALIASEILIFFAASLVLLSMRYVWDYSAFPAAVLLCPVLGRMLISCLSGRQANTKK